MGEEKAIQNHLESGHNSNTDVLSQADTANVGVAAKDHALADSDHLEKGNPDALSAEHRDYLIARHGTTDLVPLPTMDPADPLNWPRWKKNVNLFLVAFNALMTTFTAAGIIPVFENFSIDFGVSLTQASYLTSIQILILGVSPLFWKPISNHFGRRPIWLISTFGSMICNIGNAESHSYGSQIVTRILVAFFISPAIAISSAVVLETFFAHERAKKMGIWTLMVTLGPPSGPFIMGFVAYHTNSWAWIYWIFAMINGAQFILYFFLSPETLYFRNNPKVNTTTSPFRRKYMTFGKISPHSFKFSEFLTPIRLFAYPNILLPTIAYTIVFGFSSVLLTVEIPQIFTPKFGFNSQQIGLQFLGMIIGSVIGEQLGGGGSDWWMKRKASKLGRSRSASPEWRIWVAYPGFVTVIVGLIVFCLQVSNLPADAYNVSPIVGIGIAAFGNQIITTVLVTYAVDCHHEHAASIGVFVNLVRSTWGFIGPFWFPDMFNSIGLGGSAGLMCGLIVVFSVLPTIFIQWHGKPMREKRATTELSQLNTITR